MKISSKVSVFLLILLSISLVHALKVEHKVSSSMKESLSHMGETLVENSSCTKGYCMDKFGLLPDPFNPHCQSNATCWRQWYGFADCKDDNVTCWKQAVGYPKNCTDDDYDCWLKYYGYTQCEDVDCIKKVLNYTCKSDDLECWKKNSYGSKCKWNDWDCLANDTFIGFFCDQKKGIDCVKYYYGADCKQDDEDCWRKQLNMPDKECEKDVECYKKFYYLPTCKDDDLACWKGLYFGPDCKKGDMDCLKKFFYIPDCAKEKDEIQCYKKWLNYPDCKYDDGKCWKDYNKNPGYGGGLFMYYEMSFLDHNKQSHDRMSFGKIMEHKRKSMAQSHAMARQFHRKRFETMH